MLNMWEAFLQHVALSELWEVETGQIKKTQDEIQINNETFLRYLFNEIQRI